MIDQALAGGWEHRRACQYLELEEGRAWRWRRRREVGCLEDERAGGNPVHGLRPEELTAILELFETWGDVDRSHRKLAHRGSYIGRVWVSPATVRRVLAAHGLVLKRPRRVRSDRRPFPEWADYQRNSIWIYDCTHFAGCRDTPCSPSWTWSRASGSPRLRLDRGDLHPGAGRVHGRVGGRRAARADRGPPGRPGARSLSLDADVDVLAPVLLAVSDNGPQMTSVDTRAFMAMCAIAQHFGRPGTPTDQAWIESLFSHVKADWPHLDRIRDPDVLRAEASPTSATSTTRSGCTPGSGTSPPPTSTTAAAHGSAPPANAGSDTPAGPESPTIDYSTPKPTAGAPPMRRNSLPDLWL